MTQTNNVALINGNSGQKGATPCTGERGRRDELMADWALASSGELPYKIEPL